MVKKEDWKILAMPEERAQFVLEREFIDEDIHFLKEGSKPKQMEDKWFMYYDHGQLFMHRSWTGYCIFIVDISKSGKGNVIVNRNPEQYRSNDIEKDKEMVNRLINKLLYENGQDINEIALRAPGIERKSQE